MKRSIFLLGAFLMSIAFYAGGYRVALQGVRQAAMAHTSAHTRDASIMFFNPAGMSFIPEKLSVSAGVVGIKSTVEYQNLDTRYLAETESPTGTPINFSIAYRPIKDLSVGVSLTTPFGSTIVWPDGWAASDMVQEIDLKAFFFQPTISYKFAEWFALGFGFIHAKGNVNLKRSISSLGADMELDSKASGNGFNIGAYFKPTDKLDVSIAYRSNINMETYADAKATFSNVPVSLTGPGSRFPVTEDTFKAVLPMVAETTIAASYKLTPKLTVAADVNIQGWQEYKSLDITFGQATLGLNPAKPTETTQAKNYHYTTLFRIGGEYAIKENMWARLGYYHDPTPVYDEYWSPETTSTTNNAITGGFGYKWNKLNFDLMLGYVIGEHRDVNNTNYGFTGQVTSKALLFGFGLSYNAF